MNNEEPPALYGKKSDGGNLQSMPIVHMAGHLMDRDTKERPVARGRASRKSLFIARRLGFARVQIRRDDHSSSLSEPGARCPGQKLQNL